MKKLLTITEVSQLLSVHVNTLKRWEKEGIINPIRFGKRGDRKYRSEDIESLLEGGIEKKKVQTMEFPYVSVSVLIEYEERLLVGKRSEGLAKGGYSFPGGYLPFGESFEKAAIIVVKDLTGIKIRKPSVFCFTNTYSKKAEKQSVTVGLHSVLKELPVKIKRTKDFSSWDWYGIKKLPELILESDHQIVENYNSNKYYQK